MVSVKTAIFALLAFALFAPAAFASDWQTYQNHQHGFTTDYPVHLFTRRGPAVGGDGVTFSSDDKTRELSIYGFGNGDELSMETIAGIVRENYEDREVTYERVTKDWLVISGYEKNDEGRNIFYHRLAANKAGNALSVFEFIHTEAQREEIDPLLKRMSQSLTPPK